MTTRLLDLVVVNTGECKNCKWREILRDRIARDPSYVPYGGRKKCMDDKNYKNCPGYLPAGKL